MGFTSAICHPGISIRSMMCEAFPGATQKLKQYVSGGQLPNLLNAYARQVIFFRKVSGKQLASDGRDGIEHKFSPSCLR